MGLPLTDDQVRAALLLLNGGKIDLRRRKRSRLKSSPPLRQERTCIECRQTMPLQAFVRILWNQ